MPNVLERNWWESSEHLEEQRAVAEEAIRLDEERRMKEEQDAEMGEEEDEVELPSKEKQGEGNGNGAATGNGSVVADKVVARTRVSCRAETPSVQVLGRALTIPVAVQAGRGARVPHPGSACA